MISTINYNVWKILWQLYFHLCVFKFFSYFPHLITHNHQEQPNPLAPLYQLLYFPY